MININQAVTALKAGLIVAYPTEGVYGLAADATNEAAVDRLIALKKRPSSKGFIVMVSSLLDLKDWIVPLTQDEVEQILNVKDHNYRCTWLVDVTSKCPRYLIGEYNKLAIRVTNHPYSYALCLSFGQPIISTSANLHQKQILKNPIEISDLFGVKIAGVLEGELGVLNKSSRIVDLTTGQVIRK